MKNNRKILEVLSLMKLLLFQIEQKYFFQSSEGGGTVGSGRVATIIE